MTVPLRLRLTGHSLRLTGHPNGRGPLRPPPPAVVLLRIETGEVLVNEHGDHLILGPSHGQ